MKLIAIGIVIVACVVSMFVKSDGTSKYEGKVVSSQMLHKEVEKERGKPLPQYGGCCGGNNYARMDKSWTSIPDFFKKLFSGKK
jgi:hypothetical protein